MVDYNTTKIDFFLLRINYYNNFTDLLYIAKLMKLFLEKYIFISLIFLISMTGNACSSHLREFCYVKETIHTGCIVIKRIKATTTRNTAIKADRLKKIM